MELKKGKLCLTLLLVSAITWGQNQVSDSINRRLEVKNQFGVQFGGPSFLSCNYEHFFNHNWSIEAGVIMLERNQNLQNLLPTSVRPSVRLSLLAEEVLAGLMVMVQQLAMFRLEYS